MTNETNTVGKGEGERRNGQPHREWPVLNAEGQQVGEIAAEYDDVCRGYASEWKLGTYVVSLDSDGTDTPRDFRAKDYGSARKALAAAKAYAKRGGGRKCRGCSAPLLGRHASPCSEREPRGTDIVVWSECDGEAV